MVQYLHLDLEIVNDATCTYNPWTDLINVHEPAAQVLYT